MKYEVHVFVDNYIELPYLMSQVVRDSFDLKEGDVYALDQLPLSSSEQECLAAIIRDTPYMIDYPFFFKVRLAYRTEEIDGEGEQVGGVTLYVQMVNDEGKFYPSFYRCSPCGHWMTLRPDGIHCSDCGRELNIQDYHPKLNWV